MNTVARSTQHAWSRYWTRQAAKDHPFSPSIDYAAIVAAAEDYLLSKADMFEQRVKNGYRAGEECWINSKRNANVLQAWRNMDENRNVLWSLCNATGIPVDAAIRAARAMINWYKKSMNDYCPDAEKLLRVMA